MTSQQTIVIVLVVLLVLLVIAHVAGKRKHRKSKPNDFRESTCIPTLECTQSTISPTFTTPRISIPVAGSNFIFLADRSAFDTFGPQQLCLSADPWVYVNTGNITGNVFAKINLVTQQVIIIGVTGSPFLDLACGLGTEFYGIDVNDAELFAINENTAAITLLGPDTVHGNSLCAGPDGLLYGVSGTQLNTIDPVTLATHNIRNDMNGSAGDCVFFRGEFYWAGLDNHIWKISGPIATGPLVQLAADLPFTYGLAVYGCKMYGFATMTVFEWDPILGVVSSFTLPPFGSGHMLGATRLDESIQTAAYEVNIGVLDASALPINFFCQQLTVITFADPHLSFTEVIVQPSGHFTINQNYTTSNVLAALFF
jgi:hypothetical protein